VPVALNETALNPMGTQYWGLYEAYSTWVETIYSTANDWRQQLLPVRPTDIINNENVCGTQAIFEGKGESFFRRFTADIRTFSLIYYGHIASCCQIV
jgi:hypothetical protein